MPRSGCNFTAQAEADIEAIGEYIAEDNQPRAFSFVRQIRERCEKIARMPEAVPVVLEQDDVAIRRIVFGRYLIFYTLENSTVTVLRVLHGARDLDALWPDARRS